MEALPCALRTVTLRMSLARGQRRCGGQLSRPGSAVRTRSVLFRVSSQGEVKKVRGCILVVDDAVYDFLGRTVNTHTYTHVCGAHAA